MAIEGVTITTTAIIVNSQSLFRQPRGQVAIWCQGRARNLRQAARIRCPPNRSMARRGEWATGAMLASINSGVTQHDLHSLNIQLWTTSPHAKYVLEGTAFQGSRYIYTRLGYANKTAVDSWVRGKQFTMDPGQSGFVMPVRGKLYLRVHGQRANPFLTDAYASVQRKSPSLPRLTFKRSAD